MKNTIKIATAAVLSASIMAVPVAMAQTPVQPASSTGDTSNAKEQRTNYKVNRTKSMGGMEKPTRPSPTSNTGNDSRSSVYDAKKKRMTQNSGKSVPKRPAPTTAN